MEQNKIAYRKQQIIDENLNIWGELEELGVKYQAVSLGYSITHFQPPEFLVKNLFDIIHEGKNHYSDRNGHPEALKLIADYYSRLHNRTIDSKTEVLITSGAIGAINIILQSLIADENDEIILVKPWYFDYPSLCQHSRGTISSIPLTLSDDNTWKFDFELFKSVLNSKSRVFLFNNPHNPSGKSFSLEELTKISEILSEYPNCYIVSDEVYHYLNFDDKEHQILATIGDNWKKTITIISGGKMMCWTGWRVGWAIGPKEVLKDAALINEICSYGQNIPVQLAFARSLKTAYEEEYKDGMTFIEYLKNDYKKCYEILYQGLIELDIPIKPIPVSGGYYMLWDVSELRDLVPRNYFKQEEYEDDKDTIIEKVDFGDPVPLDVAVSRWFAYEKKVVTLPGSSFFGRDSKTKSDKYIRMAFCKGEEAIRQALKNLQS